MAKGLLCVAVLVCILSFAPTSSAGCSGPMYIYYQTSAKLVETGAKLVCPSVVVFDFGPNGTFQQTPFFEVQIMSCPCSGGAGGGIDEEDNPE